MFSILKDRAKPKSSLTKAVSEELHFIFNKSLKGPFPKGTKKIMLGMGCFWGVEKLFWNIPGVEMTAVGYSGGTSVNPNYKEVCSSKTGHNEVVMIHYNPDLLTFKTILRMFWEGHNPTQGMRQGNDIGSQYRSGIYTYDRADYDKALRTATEYGKSLKSFGFGEITTEIREAREFYYAEGYHQQYLAKNPNGYCGIGGTGICL
tara:strand:- start:19 stop:630 length:612 start_codon:yes stop_codon:yes gene_type:complete